MSDEPPSWESVWSAYIHRGTAHRKQIAELLNDYPNMSAAELGRRVGCSCETARKHKRSVQQEKGLTQ
jgi:predicted ArsR family transcriptional regulator